MSPRRIPSFIALVTVLLSFSGASSAQTYTITPEHPIDGDQIQVNADWPNSGNFVDTKTYSITGNSISVRFVQDGLNFGPNPIHIESSITLPPLDAGIYTMRIDGFQVQVQDSYRLSSHGRLLSLSFRHPAQTFRAESPFILRSQRRLPLFASIFREWLCIPGAFRPAVDYQQLVFRPHAENDQSDRRYGRRRHLLLRSGREGNVCVRGPSADLVPIPATTRGLLHRQLLTFRKWMGLPNRFHHLFRRRRPKRLRSNRGHVVGPDAIREWLRH
jgi:hypothetical protein